MVKGQAEVVVVIGVLLVFVVIAYYAFQDGGMVPSPVPRGVYDEQREVSVTINNMVRTSADNALRTMMTHGGYLEDPGLGVTTIDSVPNTGFILTSVPYWVRCGQVTYPGLEDIETWMERAIEDEVRSGLGDVELLYGNRAEFDRSGISAEVEILGSEPFEPNALEVSLRLPTKVRDYEMASDLYPYESKIDTKFGRIYGFGRDFADASSQERFLEHFTMAAVYFSQRDDSDVPELPTLGVLTSCGDVIYRSPADINTYLLEVLEYTLATVKWWKPMQNVCPSEGNCMDRTLDFAIQDLNGKAYEDLEIRVMMSDHWVFNVMDFVLATNFEMPSNGPFRIPVCTQSYTHAYDYSFPYILRIRDPLTGYHFNLAGEASVGDRGDEIMAPAECLGSGSVPADCQDLACQGTVRVVEESGAPVKGAWVIHGDCPLGEQTGQDGEVSGPVKCGTSMLKIFKDSDFELKEVEVSSDDLSGGYEVTLNRVNPKRVHFREIIMTEDGYNIGGGEEETITDASCRSCGYCSMDVRKTTTCSIRPVDGTEVIYSRWDNGQRTYPVTNFEADSIDPACSEEPGCEFCQEHSDQLQSATGSLRDQIQNACLTCAQSCSGTPVTSILVDYIPSGYTYSVDTDMFNPLDEYRFVGQFEDESLYMGSEVTDVYLNIPRRSPDRTHLKDFMIEENELECLRQTAQRCGIPLIETETGPSTTVVVDDCSCERLRAYAEACGAGDDQLDSLFCECGDSSGGCSSCGGFDQPPCTWCCPGEDPTQALELLESLEESCNLRVICG